MQERSRKLPALITSAALICVALFSSTSAAVSPPKRPTARPAPTATPILTASDARTGAELGIIDGLAAIDLHERLVVLDYVAGIYAAQQAEEAARLEEAHMAAARAVASPAPASGPHTDAWWSGVAQCEQGGRNDSYFGYFSFMDGSQGGRPWAEQVAAGNALLQRAGREVGPWAQSCVNAGYNASPSG